MKEGIYVIIAFVLGWAMAQLIKVILFVISQGGADGIGMRTVLKMAMKSGGMPSGHTASLMAATMFLGLKLGFNSYLFALSLVVSMIVAYDAVNVRWAVGEQGKMLKKITRRNFRIVEGHTVPEMLVGLVLGLIIGAITYGISNLA